MRTDLCERLGIEYPIVGFSPSEHVVAAISRAGGLGVLGCVRFNDPDELDAVLSWLDTETAGRPYGVDVVMPSTVPTEGAPSGDSVPATAVRGMWWGKNDEGPFLYYVLKLQEKDRARLVTGRRYALVPVEPEQGCRFAVADGVSVVVPK